MRFQINDRWIGPDDPLYFIADIAANHDGDLGRAFKLIELAKAAGAHAAKFQNFQAAKIVSRLGFEALGAQSGHQAAWKKPVFEVYQDASLDLGWTAQLKKHCDEVGIEYMTSPYDFDSVDHVDPYLRAYKIGSGDISWHGIIEHIGRKGKPVLLATGAADMAEVEAAMHVLNSVNRRVVLMQCNTNYTALPENFPCINLNVLRTYARRFPDAVLGLSDHTHGPATVLGAVALGARVFEKHFTDDRSREGPDHRFSVVPAEWTEMVQRAGEVYAALGDGVKKVEPNERQTAVLQKRALRYACGLKAGQVLRAEHFFPLRPAPEGSVPPHALPSFVGKKLLRDVREQDLAGQGDV